MVDNCLINTCSHVRLVCALVQQRLNVGLCKHTATGSDGVESIVLQACSIHFLYGHIQQNGHLVNECTGTACAGAVHAFIGAALEEQYLCIFATQLDDCTGVGLQHTNHFAGCVYFLHEGDVCGIRQTQACGAGNGNAELTTAENGLDFLHHFNGLLTNLGEVAAIFFVNDLAVIDDNYLCGGRADIDAHGQSIF